MTNNGQVKVKYYQPLYYGNSSRGSGWYFVVPAVDIPNSEGDNIVGMYRSKAECAAVIRTFRGVTAHNDNFDRKHADGMSETVGEGET